MGGQELRVLGAEQLPRHPALGGRAEGMVADPGRPACGPWDQPKGHTHLAHRHSPCVSQTVVLSSHPVARLGSLCFEKSLPCHRGSTHFPELQSKVLASCSTLLRGCQACHKGSSQGLGGEDRSQAPLTP